MDYGDRFVLTLFAKDPELAAQADRAGIDRVGLDLETLGKEARQGGLATWISDHAEADLPAVAERLTESRLFARCNPIHAESAAEIERLLAAGVRTIMLPWFRTVGEAARFLDLVGGRAHPVLLLETAEAAAIVEQLCRLPGVAEIHVGLNDLRLSLGWASHFHVLVSDLLEHICKVVRDAGVALAVGGVGRAGDKHLPVPSDLVLAQYPRLGAEGALVSRAFFRSGEALDLCDEVRLLRTRLSEYSAMPASWLRERRRELAERVERA